MVLQQNGPFGMHAQVPTIAAINGPAIGAGLCVAALCDACDCLVHAFVAVAHASDAFDHHAVHVAEERGIRLALLGFACAVVGEIASNNRVGRCLSALTHHRKQD